MGECTLIQCEPFSVHEDGKLQLVTLVDPFPELPPATPYLCFRGPSRAGPLRLGRRPGGAKTAQSRVSRNHKAAFLGKWLPLAYLGHDSGNENLQLSSMQIMWRPVTVSAAGASDRTQAPAETNVTGSAVSSIIVMTESSRMYTPTCFSVFTALLSCGRPGGL